MVGHNNISNIGVAEHAICPDCGGVLGALMVSGDGVKTHNLSVLVEHGLGCVRDEMAIILIVTGDDRDET